MENETSVELKTNKADLVIELSLRYKKNKFNWARCEEEPRCYELVMQPVVVSSVYKIYEAMSGYRILTDKIERKSKKAKKDAVTYLMNMQSTLKRGIENIANDRGVVVENYDIMKVLKELEK